MPIDLTSEQRGLLDATRSYLNEAAPTHGDPTARPGRAGSGPGLLEPGRPAGLDLAARARGPRRRQPDRQPVRRPARSSPRSPAGRWPRPARAREHRCGSAGFDAGQQKSTRPSTACSAVTWCRPGRSPRAMGRSTPARSRRRRSAPARAIGSAAPSRSSRPGSDADVFLVTARDGDGLVQLLVARSATGLSVTSQHGLDPSRGYGAVTLDGVEVPATARVGGDGPADDQVQHLLDVAVAIQSAETVGVMYHAFDMTMEWVNQRVAFGRVDRFLPGAQAPAGRPQALARGECRVWSTA